MRGITLFLGLMLSFALAPGAQARDRIQIVGSSTVYPFATTVAEHYGKSTNFKTPIVESTGTGGGMKLFCAGTQDNTPDIVNASRAIKSSEVELCKSNGVTDIIEIKIGYDGIVVANSREAERLNLSRKDLYLALAKDVPTEDGGWTPNPNATWRDVNASLPNRKIEVYGPPPTSGTRDAFVELAMEGGCKTFGFVAALKKSDKQEYKRRCHTIREDGAYIEAGENDNLIVQKLAANKKAFGIFGFSYLDQNADKVQGSLIDGAEPVFENISDGSYPVSRPLFFYVKASHVDQVPGINEFLAEFTSESAWGPEGYLVDKGLIPMPDAERASGAKNARDLGTM